MENRFRIVGETLRAVREAVGKDYPVLIKLNSYERAKDGIKPLECAYFSRLIEKTGCCDAIEISGGTNECGFVMARGAFPTKGIPKYLRPYCEMKSLFKFGMRVFVAPIIGLLQPKFTHGYNLDAAAMVKDSISLPVITVGGMRERKRMDNAIREGKTDFVSMARPLLLEPDLPNKFKNGQSDVAQCDNCNICVVATDSVPISSLVLKFVFFLAGINPKSEYRKPKQYRMTKNTKFKTKRNSIIMMTVKCLLSATTQRQGAPTVSNI